MRFLLFILNHISERTIVGFFEFLRKIHRSFYYNSHPSLPIRDDMEDGYIENQHRYSHIPYGKSNISYAGCEVIATYNALLSLGERHYIPFSQILLDYARDGMVFNGRFGSSPKAIADYLSAHGCNAVFSIRPNEFSDIIKSCHCAIFSYFNDRNDLKGGIHTICLTKDLNGKIIAHNVHCNGSIMGPFSTYSDFLNSIPSAKAICLTGVFTA